MLHGVTTAIEQFGAQDYTVPYRYNFIGSI